MEKLILLVGLFLFCTSVSALNLSINLSNAYTMEQNPATSHLLDQINTYDSTADTVQGYSQAGGIKGNYWDFERGGDHNVQFSYTSTPASNLQKVTINTWVNFESLPPSGNLYYLSLHINAGGTKTQEWYVYNNSGVTTIRNYIKLEDSAEKVQNVPHNFNVGDWYMFTQKYNGTYLFLYVNGTLLLNESIEVKQNETATYSKMVIGNKQFPALGQSFDGLIDEYYIWNRSLSDTEIEALWNDGAGYFYPFAGASNPVYSGYYPYGGYNYSRNLSYSMTLYCEDNPIINVTRYINGSWSASDLVSCTGATTTYTGTYNHSREVNYTIHFETNHSYNDGIRGNSTFLQDLYDPEIKLNFTLVNNFNTTEANISLICTDSLTPILLYNLSLNNETYFYANATNNTKILNHTNFTSGTNTAEGFCADFFTNVTDSITRSIRTLGLTFRDEISKTILDTRNISINIIGDEESYNYSTGTGTITILGLLADIYAIRYDATDYFERFYFANISGDIINNLTLYLVNDSLAEEITATVYDQNNELLEGTYIQMLRYDLATNGYNLVEMGLTNWEGETKLHPIRNDEYYRFFLYYPFGTLRQSTNPTYIYDTSIVFQISTAADIAADYSRSRDVTYSLTFSNTTNIFTYTFANSGTTISQGCLRVLRVDAKGFEHLIDETCVSGTSGSINIEVTAQNDTTYIGNGYVTISGSDWFIDGLTYSYPTQDEYPNQLIGLLIIFIMTISFAFVLKLSIELGIILIPLPLLFGSIMHIIRIAVPVAIGIEIAAVILAIVMNKVID